MVKSNNQYKSLLRKEYIAKRLFAVEPLESDMGNTRRNIVITFLPIYL